MRIMGVRENVMRKIGNIFKILFWAAPFSTAVTVLYYICQAIIPALSTILFAGILQGVIELQEGNRELLIKNVAIYLGMRGGMYFLNYGYSVLVNTGIFEKGSMCFRQFLQEKTARMPLYNMENSKILDQKKRAERTVEEDVPAMVFYQFLEAASAADALPDRRNNRRPDPHKTGSGKIPALIYMPSKQLLRIPRHFWTYCWNADVSP